MYHWREKKPLFLNLQPTVPLVGRIVIAHRCPILLIAVIWKLRPETDWQVNNDSVEKYSIARFLEFDYLYAHGKSPNSSWNHGFAAVQAVVMVTPVLIGNGHFWTTVNKKIRKPLSPKVALVITLVPSMCVRNLVAICSRGTSRHEREVLHLCPLSTLHLSHPFFSCARPQVERLNQSWWLMAETTRLDPRKCLLSMRIRRKYIQGVYDPKNFRFFDIVGKSQAKHERSITLKQHVLATYS